MAVEPTLAEKWEGDVGLRARARNIGRLTQWQIKDNVELTGVPNMHSTVLNVRCLELLAEWYCHQIRVPVSIPIDVLREQACWLFNFLFFFLKKKNFSNRPDRSSKAFLRHAIAFFSG